MPCFRTDSYADENNNYLAGRKIGPGPVRLGEHGREVSVILRISEADWRDVEKQEAAIRMAEILTKVIRKISAYIKKKVGNFDDECFLEEFYSRLELLKRDALNPMREGMDMVYIETERYRYLKSIGII